MFSSRTQAGKALAERLQQFHEDPVVVLAIPRGGIPVAAEIAKALMAPLDVVFSKKIGHPRNPEVAIGAVSMEDCFLLSDSAGSRAYVEKEIQRIRAGLKKKAKAYHRQFAPCPLESQVVIIVDDGIATGSTILSTALLVARKEPLKVIIATPVAPPTTLEYLEQSGSINEVICLFAPPDFSAVGQFYEDFNAVTDAQAIALLERTNHFISKKAP